MKAAIVFIALLVCFAAAKKWAVLVAGSNTYSNYRHQADIFHLYQALIKNKFNPENIIVFAYDDIANNARNPFPGKVFNKPTYSQPGVDVYAGVKIDYKGANVSPKIFLDVLEGNKTAVRGKGTEKTLDITPEDNVFMFFSDHGAPNLIAFPSEYLYADKLLQSLAKIEKKYKKFVFYLETCESGSMFVKLPTNTKFYAVSAANPTESSWGTYCSPDDVVQGKHVGSCLGDLFSVNFIEDFDETDPFTETLDQQFQKVRAKTTMSHVMQWGDVSFTNDFVSDFVAEGRKNDNMINLRKVPNKLIDLAKQSSIDSRMMKVKLLSQIYMR